MLRLFKDTWDPILAVPEEMYDRKGTRHVMTSIDTALAVS